ncbi:MAG: GDP-mannose 4,6-dehydratase [Candidatus Omnitrophica bacterium]|nr:GDP-mannose 4,6-dehydratase [Candidatus Omnitrophota bacterium]
MREKILIIGASGFSGFHLIKFLKPKGFEIHGTFYRHLRRDSEIEWHSLNLQHRQQVFDLLKTLKPSGIFHLGAQSVPRFSWKHSQETFAINTLGTLNILESMRSLKLRSRLVFASTSQVYGRAFYLKEPLQENSLMMPDSPYAASKGLAELSTLNFAARFKLDAVIARPTNHIGTGQRSDFVFSDWCRQIAMAEQGKRGPVLEVGDLTLGRDFLDVRDVVKAYWLLFVKGKSGQIYNIASGKCRPLSDYATFLMKQTKLPMRVRVHSDRRRGSEPSTTLLEIFKMKKIGWRIQSNAFQALKAMLGEWRNKVS